MTASPNDLAKAQELLLEVDGANEGVALEIKDLLRRMLEFANTGRPKGLPGARELVQGGQTFLVITPEIEAQHTQLRADLASLVKLDLSGPAVARLRRQARHVMVRSYAMDHGRLVRKERHFVNDLGPLLADVLLLVRSDDTLQDDVKQCRLARCGRFFLASDLISGPSAKGRRRHRFCCDEHMDEGQTPGAKRMARSRANRNKHK
jgi:hypothetical protein